MTKRGFNHRKKPKIDNKNIKMQIDGSTDKHFHLIPKGLGLYRHDLFKIGKVVDILYLKRIQDECYKEIYVLETIFHPKKANTKIHTLYFYSWDY